MNRAQKRLSSGHLTKKRRRKIERELDYHVEWLEHAEQELKPKHPAFSEAICRIEAVLRELAGIHEELSNVSRFEHRAD